MFLYSKELISGKYTNKLLTISLQSSSVTLESQITCNFQITTDLQIMVLSDQFFINLSGFLN